MRQLFIFFLLLFFTNVNAQTYKKFILIDDTTEDVVPFANVIFNNMNYKGTSSDIDGVFYVPNTTQEITISYVGYETKVLQVNSIPSIYIRLKPQVSELDEVVIDSENPAHRIIRLAIANKDINNPNNLDSYTYNSYDKIVIKSENKSREQDSSFLRLKKIMNGSYIFITETISKHKYLKPRLTQDSIIATKSSGFKMPNFAILANSFQPFSFYDEHIVLFETNYLNPISKGSTKKYKFRLKEEIIKDQDTLFVISFEPKTNRNFEGLKGVLTINSNKYAVQSVDAETVNSGKISFVLQQKYNIIDDEYWFPEQLNFELVLGSQSNIVYVGKSYIDNVELNAPLTPKDFSITSNILPEGAKQKSDEFWKLNRRDTLDFRERRTYVFIDSLGKKYKADKVISYLPKLSEGRIPLKYIDVDILELAKVNKYEGARVGLGLYTNEDINKVISVGGYGAYGFRDQTWKYGAAINLDFSKEKEFEIDLQYKNDILETGNFSGDRIESPFSPRNWIAGRFDALESYSIKTNMHLFRNVNWSLGYNTSKISPLYDYQFLKNGNIITDYTNSEFQFGLSYYSEEKLTNIFGMKVREPSNKPVIHFLYARGLQNTFDSDFEYNKFRITLDHSFITKGLGKTTYRLDLGYIDNSLPYGLLFTGEGAYDPKIPFVVKNYFQTMRPYEFLSDKYASLFTTHNFGRLLNSKGYIRPDIVLHNNFSVGDLSSTNNHELIAFKTKNEIFAETGLELQNLFRVDLHEMFYLTFGVGAFYRYGYHHLENSDDNFALKYGFSFSFN